MTALREAFLGAIENIEPDTDFSITGAAQPEWLLPHGRVPAAARAARRRVLLADHARETRRAAAASRRRLPEEPNPVWNLDRIDQAVLPLDKVYRYNTAGSGVNV